MQLPIHDSSGQVIDHIEADEMLVLGRQIPRQGARLPQQQGSPSGRSIREWRGEEADAHPFSGVEE